MNMSKLIKRVIILFYAIDQIDILSYFYDYNPPTSNPPIIFYNLLTL